MTAFPKIVMLSMAPLVAHSSTSAGERNRYADHYLSDSQTPETIKAAITKGVVILGMCPYQAFAAAGDPGPYYVKPDPSRWPAHSDPVTIIQSQCSNPDKSTVELMFKNTSQFGSKDPVVFRVRFIEGRAVLIDQKGFTED